MGVLSRLEGTSLSYVVKALTGSITWRNLVLLYVLFNLKSVPFSWHVRLFFHLFRNLRFKRHTFPETGSLTANGDVEQRHPIFTPVSVMSRTSLFETDYNLHKSNSTYFTDLDIGRTALVTRLYTPGMELVNREMEREVDENGKMKYPGRITVMLGSVYCSFKKEVLPYEKYEMQSKIAGWDRKWMYIMTFFLRPEKKKGEGKTILAISVSKYVAKKGRLTVPPARVLTASGLLPPRPADAEQLTSPSVTETPSRVDAINAGEGLDEPLVREVLSLTESADLDKAMLENQQKANSLRNNGGWSWERLEKERQRGLEFLQAFIDVDEKLADEVDLR